MTYAEAVARLLALRGGEYVGMRPGLERIEALLDALGRPERGYVIAQVGGTNGKGSISAMLAAMLRAEGRRVGLYTSPHLVSFRERIRVNGEAIGEDAVSDLRRSLESQGQEQLEHLAATLSLVTPAPQVDTAVLAGKPSREICALARTRNVDLIALGVTGRGAIDLAVLGSTTHQVVRHAPCAVLTVPLRH
jgi:folylpolyglutamate synthase/dihydropteroate synthase